MKKRRPLLVASVFIAVMVVVGFLVFDGIALALFDFVLGNNVYALQVSYVPSLDSLGNAKVTVTLNTLMVRMPIETVLTGYTVHVDAASTFNDTSFSIIINVRGTMANDVPVYGHTFTFQDGQARTVTCYLRDYDAGKYPVLHASVWGSTVYGGLSVDFGYDGAWTN
jgi:hypothetical protein